MMVLHIGERRRRYEVASFAEASAVYCAARERSGKGASQFPSGHIMRDGTLIARVSYNGKVWPPAMWHVGQAPLFNPYG